MCSFIVTNITSFVLKLINLKLIPRGPDITNTYKYNNYTFVHNLLHMTGSKTTQPFVNLDEKIVCIYNGEIYNYKEFGNYKSDGECLIDLYLKLGEKFVKKLDGEYAIILIDFKKNKLLLITDTFSKKPLYYSINNDKIGIASYESAITKLGLKDVKKMEANKLKIYDLKSLKLIKDEEIYKFDLRQYKDTYDDVLKALEEAVLKRCKNSPYEIFVCLSSGYDSGTICAILNKYNIEYHTYTIIGKEDKNILKKRWKLNKDNVISCAKLNYEWRNFKKQKKKIQECEDFNMKTTREDYDIKKDAASVGMSFICEDAKKNKRRIYLSGQGADEIISDYSINGEEFYNLSCFGGKFPDNLKDIFPKSSLDEDCIWKNFYNNFQKAFLGKEEYISGFYGIEGRYPYLDKNFVQEYLSLTKDLKMKFYKSPLHEYMTRENYPFKIEKQGFAVLK